MKQVIGIFMAMVLVFVVIGMAIGEELNLVDYSVANDYLEEWMEIYGFDMNRDNVYEDDVFYYYGCLSVNSWKSQYGTTPTVEIFEKQTIQERGDIISINTKMIGEIEGHNIYMTEALAENGLYYEYNHVIVIWMFCK